MPLAGGSDGRAGGHKGVEMLKKFSAEAIGTFMIVSAVCGAGAPGLGSAGVPVVALAAGLATMAMMYAAGHVSGGHFNPVVTIGLAAAGRHHTTTLVAYVVAQVVGAVAAAFVWYVIAIEVADPSKLLPAGNFGSNGFDNASPGHFNLAGVAVTEVLATALLVFVFAGATAKRAAHGFAPLAVGAIMVALLIITIPISNGALNPARSTATALFGGTLAISQLWLFWLTAFVGAVLGGLMARWVNSGH